MAKTKIRRTISSHNDDKDVDSVVIEKQRRSDQVRRDDDNIQTPTVDLENIDTSIIRYIQDEIKPTLTINNKVVNVPIIYSSGEKWSDIQRLGNFRNIDGKVHPPLISIKRTSINEISELPRNNVIKDKANNVLLTTRYTQKSRYDRFSVLHNQIPKKEVFYVNVPKHIEVSYEIKIWCDKQVHLNKIAEVIFLHSGRAFGDKNQYKFITSTDSVSFDSSNDSGTDRIINGNISLKTKAYLIPENDGLKNNLKKGISIGKVEFTTNLTDDISKSYTQSPTEELNDRYANSIDMAISYLNENNYGNSPSNIGFANISAYDVNNEIVNLKPLSRNDTLLISGSGFLLEVDQQLRKITFTNNPADFLIPNGTISSSQQVLDYNLFLEKSGSGVLSSSNLSISEEGLIISKGNTFNNISDTTKLLTISTNNYDSLHLNYNIKSSTGGAYRAGNVTFIWDNQANRVTHIDTHTEDIGLSTGGVLFSASFDGTDIDIYSTISGGLWNLKVGGMVL